MFPEGGHPVDWDHKRIYTGGRKTLSVYVTTRKRKMLKIGMNMTLADVFLRASGTNKDGERPVGEDDGVEVKDGCLNFFVLPKGDAERNFVEDFKRKRDGKN